jgi:PBP1b-binding outer membrane lipoprotein LpoB|tara:strand:- start:3131 stop:3334 length:204 start_codon:yes stop_codon:yes gene_type:complete
MRIINIIQNEFLLDKMKLENELERTLNDKTFSTDQITKQSVEIINKLANTNNSLETLESYLNKEEEK